MAMVTGFSLNKPIYRTLLQCEQLHFDNSGELSCKPCAQSVHLPYTLTPRYRTWWAGAGRWSRRLPSAAAAGSTRLRRDGTRAIGCCKRWACLIGLITTWRCSVSVALDILEKDSSCANCEAHDVKHDPRTCPAIDPLLPSGSQFYWLYMHGSNSPGR